MKTFEIRYNNLYLVDVRADEMEIKEGLHYNFLYLWVGDRIIMTKKISDEIEIFEENDFTTVINFKEIKY